MTNTQLHFESLYPKESWKTEIEQMLNYIKEGNSAQLIGLPGVGRANLLRVISYNEHVRKLHLGEQEKWFLFVLANFSEVKEKPLSEILKFILLSIQEALRELDKKEEFAQIDSLVRRSFTMNHELGLLGLLKEVIDYLCIQKQLTLVLLFDKFEYFIKSLNSQLFSHLSVLRSRAKYRFSVVFSLDRPLEDYFDPHFFAEFFSIFAGHNIYLPLSDKPALDFRIAYIEKTTGRTVPQDLKQNIFDLTGTHANYTRIAVEELCSSFVIPDLIRDLAVDSRFRGNDKLFEFLINNRPIRSVSYEIWEGLRAEEQKFIFDVILRPKAEESLQYLEQIGLIKNLDSGLAKMTIPLFEDFVSFRAKQKTIDKIIFDPQTNTIKQGEFLISDNLTGLEFKLLKFLLEHEQKVLSRDEVINGVWQELASTAGVTEQALDQLIFRLRRKIEPDPNSPTHLLTIKGRGFKFII